MNFLQRLFHRPKVECPRCLGKGHVDEADIIRLNRQFLWVPGDCAYCGGKGRVLESMLSKVAVDNAILTTNRTAWERIKIMNNDADVVEIEKEWANDAKNMRTTIAFLHSYHHLDAEQIYERLFGLYDSEIPLSEKERLMKHIVEIITEQ